MHSLTGSQGGGDPLASGDAMEEGREEIRKPNTLICPNCGHIQTNHRECTQCGIIIAKYLEAHLQTHAKIHHTPSLIIHESAKRSKQIGILIVLLFILVVALHHWYTNSAIRHPPGILVASEPDQVIIRNPKPWVKGNRVFVPLATFHLKARVLSSESYYLDSQADISPLDLALGWGPMSDQRVLDRLDIVQGNRCFVWQAIGGELPIARSEVITHSSNMHMIPSTDEVRRSLKSIRTGEIVQLTGYLVGIQENGHWTWVSSLRRTDTGNGACEIVWVENVIFP